jgi:acyl-CoA hydrolase
VQHRKSALIEQLNSVEQCVEQTIARVGNDLRLAAPLGLGKPNQLINAFYRRVENDPTLTLHIYTALSLELPIRPEGVEQEVFDGIIAKLFGDYEELDYMRALRGECLPSNIDVSEFYFKAGAMKRIPYAQQHYISSNYTHVARDLADKKVNVLVNLVATRGSGEDFSVSLSCNTDTAIDLRRLLDERHDHVFVTLGQSHSGLPFMPHDAVVDPQFYDMVVCNPQYDKKLFGVPNAAVPITDYAAALHASSLICDGGTLQIGIGSLGDAVAHACIVRHENSATYRQLLEDLTFQECPIAEAGEPFSEGLYASTEMFVNGMMHLIEHDIVKRKVYDNVILQKGLNSGAITSAIDQRLWAYIRAQGLLPQALTAAKLQEMQYWGIIVESASLINEQLVLDGKPFSNDMDDEVTQQAVLAASLGQTLKHGIILHGGFFLGPNDFYEKLNTLDEATLDQICMTSVGITNQLLANVELYSAQRQQARFINTGMMVTLTGAVASDALESGSVVSGVGGQYNFVAMAHDLPGARSILCIRSTRGSGDQLKSNIVPFYGHITVPKHLRDIIVTEYGIADLRGQDDADIIRRLINIADSRFQAELLEFAKANDKLPADYEIPLSAQNNTPEKISAILGLQLGSGLLPDFPFGSALMT